MNWLGFSHSVLMGPVILAIKVTIVLGLSWLGARLLSRQSAAQRHRVWLAGILGALLLPLLASVVPLRYSASLGEAAARWESRIALATAMVPDRGPVMATNPVQIASHSKLPYFLLAIWALGFCLLALRLFAGLRRLARIRAGSTFLRDKEWADLAAELSSLLDVRPPVRILLSSDKSLVPVTWGMMEGTVVLPSIATQWAPQRRRIVLAHELAHVARHDWLMQMCGEFLCCVYWFHPLAWTAARRLRLESERACDDAVLNTSVRASDYASELLELVQTLRSPSRAFAPALAFVRPSNLERRFEAMLATSVNRNRLSTKIKLLIAVVACCLLIPLAALSLPAQVDGSGVPKGWLLAGSKPGNYFTGIDREAIYQGHASAFLKGKPTATEGFGTLMQSFSATQYVGQRVRLSAAVKSEDVNDWAGLWMRVDQGQNVVAFDNMQSRAIKGTSGWQEYSVVLDVPQDSTGISFGVLLSKAGAVWISNLKFETVGNDVSVTGWSTATAPREPANLDFQQ